MTAADEVMYLVREYAAGMGVRGPVEQTAAYLAVRAAVDALAAAPKQEPKQAAGWAVVDAEGRALFGYITASDFPAHAELVDGRRIAPLVLADLDDVEDES